MRTKKGSRNKVQQQEANQNRDLNQSKGLQKRGFRYDFWQMGLLVCIAIGGITGLIGSFFPESIFYETIRYYNVGSEAFVRETSRNQLFFGENFLNLVPFWGIRVFIPGLLFLVGIFGNTRFFRLLFDGAVFLQLLGISMQSLLLFGAFGMSRWLVYQVAMLLPEGFYLLAIIEGNQMRRQKQTRSLSVWRSWKSITVLILLLTVGCCLEMIAAFFFFLHCVL